MSPNNSTIHRIATAITAQVNRGLSITHAKPDPTLTVGSSIAAGTSKLGVLLDFSHVEEQALARYTQDAGNHAEIEIRPAAALSTP